MAVGPFNPKTPVIILELGRDKNGARRQFRLFFERPFIDWLHVLRQDVQQGTVDALLQALAASQDRDSVTEALRRVLVADNERAPKPNVFPFPEMSRRTPAGNVEIPSERIWSKFQVIQDTRANRSTYRVGDFHPAFYVETDSSSNLIYYTTDAGAWKFLTGTITDAIANRPGGLGANDVGVRFYATDTFRLYYWTGAAWVEDILSVFEMFGGTTSSFPALKRSTTTLQARLADDSAYTAFEVLDEAYGSGWNGKVEVPTKNAVYDQIETVSASVSALPTLASGVYTPTLTGTFNVTAATAYQCQYMRVGSVVTVSGRFDLDPTGAGITNLRISLPIASAVAAVEDVGGTAAPPAVAGEAGPIFADVGNGAALMQYTAVDLTNKQWAFSFTYRII